MPRQAYVNGRFLPHAQAAVHIEDRGYQFGDGVYEVVSVLNKRPIDTDGHLDRLDRSLRELRIDWPVTRSVLNVLMRQILRRNGIKNGIVYIQITRGVAPRDHKFPKNATPSLVMTASKVNHLSAPHSRRCQGCDYSGHPLDTMRYKIDIAPAELSFRASRQPPKRVPTKRGKSPMTDLSRKAHRPMHGS